MSKIQEAPKTTISTIIFAILVYLHSRGFIGTPELELLSHLSVLVAVMVNKEKISSYFKQK